VLVAVLVGLALAACTQAPAAGPARTSTTGVAASVTSTATPSPSTSTFVPRTVTVVMTGDVLLHNTVVWQAQRDAAATAAKEPHGLTFGPIFADQKAAVSAADLAICQLETPFAPPGGPYTSYPVFQVPQDVLGTLKDIGYDACTSASNHSLDGGFAAIVRTADALDAYGLAHTGTVRTAAEAATPLVIDAGGVKVGLINFAYGTNGIPVPEGKPWAINLIDIPAMLKAAHDAKAAGADIVLAAVHAGDEYGRLPSEEQKQVAQALTASADVDLVYGHHVHVVQPFDRVNGKWVAYGLGNTVADQAPAGKREFTRGEAMARFTFTETAPGRFEVSLAEVLPGAMGFQPPIRYVDLGRVLADPDVSAGLKARYQAVRADVIKAVGMLGAFDKGLTIGK
jgi:poly-gamma-glutamate synthesis protein (capsule biosynthesis protein)